MSAQIDDGGLAFPSPVEFDPNGQLVSHGSFGMTLSDWFAGQALAAVLPITLKVANDAKQTRADAIAIAADLAVDAADVLTAALRGGRS